MTQPIPVVVAALEEEIAPLVARMSGRVAHGSDGLVTRWGELCGRPVLTAVVGDGARPADRRLGRLLSATEPERLLLVGVAGGLSDDLGVGSLIQAGSVGRVPGDARWTAPGASIPGVPEGSVVTADRIASTAAAKRELWKAVGRPPRCVVDLESWGIVERTENLDVPWTVVRAVIDAAHEDLPLDFGALSDAEGRVVRSRVLRSLLRKPLAIRGVLELRSRVRTCAARLADVAQTWLGT